MQTQFTITQLQDPQIQEADEILRRCVHCGLCTATCPTYIIRGDELDSPRGRIYLIKEMLEKDEEPSTKITKHIDRCLSCLSCMTTCPSGVDYMHLVDLARERIEERTTRPAFDHGFRILLSIILPRPWLFRLCLLGASMIKPFRGLLPKTLTNMITMAPDSVYGASPVDTPQSFPAHGPALKRVALMNGCAQQVLGPEINEATIRLLTRHGCEVIVAEHSGCCGALEHHMGKSDPARKRAKQNIAAWSSIENLDAVVVNASGCGTTLKDYGHMLRDDPEWAAQARTISSLCKDISELLTDMDLSFSDPGSLPTVAYHSACSMQHGQKLGSGPISLLEKAGFTVVTPQESHLCCGSAGTYNLTQPELAGELGKRKADNLRSTGASVIAAGNIGCQVQIEQHGNLPVVHTVELLDWATGGPKPSKLA